MGRLRRRDPLPGVGLGRPVFRALGEGSVVNQGGVFADGGLALILLIAAGVHVIGGNIRARFNGVPGDAPNLGAGLPHALELPPILIRQGSALEHAAHEGVGIVPAAGDELAHLNAVRVGEGQQGHGGAGTAGGPPHVPQQQDALPGRGGRKELGQGHVHVIEIVIDPVIQGFDSGPFRRPAAVQLFPGLIEAHHRRREGDDQTQKQ